MPTFWPGRPTPRMVTREELAAPVAAVSIASWILVYSPQLYETWARQSGDGLSVTFIVIWLAADALNGIGAFQQKLMPSMVVLAVYYCVCDLILLWQYYYYRHLQRVRARKHLEARARGSFGTDESTPLIAGATSDICDAEDDLDDADLDIDLTHDLAAAAAADEDVALALAEDEADEATEAEQWWIPVLKYLAAILFVVCSGLAVWALSPKLDAQPLVFTLHEGAEWRWDAQVAGWISAVLYLTSRIPQILLNRKTHCEGLSMALFIFTVLANGTYVASILLKSTERWWVMENLSWIIGSLGTLGIDIFVLGQFIYYAPVRRHEEHLAKRKRILLKVRARARQRAAATDSIAA